MKPYKDWNEEDYAKEYRRMKSSFETFSPVPQKIQDYILVAYHADERDAESRYYWDWRTSDGGTGTGEKYWETKFFPPYTGHDYFCVVAENAETFEKACRIRKIGDVLLKDALLAYNVPKWWSRVEYWAVRRYWLIYRRWRVKKAIRERDRD